MFKSLKLKAYQYLPEALPFLFAIILVNLPLDPFSLRILLKPYLIFVFLFITWKAVRNLFVFIKEGKDVLFAHYFSLFVMSVASLIMLQVLKSMLDEVTFYFTLTAFLAGLILTYFEYKKRFFLAITVNFLLSGIYTVLGFFVLGAFQTGATVFFAFLIACLCSSRYIAMLVYENKLDIFGLNLSVSPEYSAVKKVIASVKNFRRRTLAVIYALGLILAPAGMIGMVVFGYLPYRFSNIMFILPLAAKLISTVNLSDGKNLDRQRFFIDTSSISLLFIVIIGLIKLY